MTRHILPWLRCCARDALVLLADPGRAYLPKQGLTVLDRVEVPTTLELEDRTSRLVTLFRLHPD
jgi:predicted nicotinamide N-methyase